MELEKKTATQNSVRLTHHTLGGLLPGSSIFIIFGGKNWDHYFVLRECLKYYDKIYSNFEKIRQSFRSEIQKKKPVTFQILFRNSFEIKF